MFSGKTRELFKLLTRAVIAKLRVKLIKHAKDDRYSKTDAASHDGMKFPSIPLRTSQEILEEAMREEIDVLGIEEAQFFDAGLLEVCETLANHGVRVILAGIDMDWAGRPYGCMPQLMAKAEKVRKLRAICVRCGEKATFSRRLHDDDSLVVIGGQEEYEALCRGCYNDVH